MSSPLLLGGLAPESTESPDIEHLGIEQPGQSNPQGRIPGEARFSRSEESYKASGLAGGLGGLGLAANIAGLVDATANLAFNIRRVYRSVSTAPHELEILSRRVVQYSSLLQTVKAVFHTALPEDLRDMGWELLEDSVDTVNEVQHIIEKMNIKPGSRNFAVVKFSLRWEYDYKSQVQKIMEDLESLKSTCSVMLQLCQTYATERQSMIIDQRSREVVKHFRETFMMAQGCFDVLERRIDGRASADASLPT